jgi:hypothetical protein
MLHRSVLACGDGKKGEDNAETKWPQRFARKSGPPREVAATQARCDAHWAHSLEGGRSIDPEQPGFGTAGIFPAVGGRAFEVEAVAGTQAVVALMLEPDFEFAPQDVEKFLAFVRVRFSAASARFHSEEMWLHSSVTPGEKFHAYFGIGLEDFAFVGTHERGSVAVGIKERNDIGFVKARDAAQRGDGRTHLAALKGAKKTDGDACGTGHLCEGKSALHTQTAEDLSGRLASFGGNNRVALFFQNVNDGGGVEPARAPKKNSTLQQAHIRFGIETITAFRALRRDESEGFPSAQR